MIWPKAINTEVHITLNTLPFYSTGLWWVYHSGLLSLEELVSAIEALELVHVHTVRSHVMRQANQTIFAQLKVL